MIYTAAQILVAVGVEDVPRKQGRPRTISYQGDVCLDDDGECTEVYGLGRCSFHYKREVRRRKAAGEHAFQRRCASTHGSGLQCERNTHKTLTRDNTKDQVKKSPHRAGDLSWM